MRPPGPATQARRRSRRPRASRVEQALELGAERLALGELVGLDRAGELGEQLALALVQATRDDDVDDHAQVTGAGALQLGHPLVAQGDDVAGLRAGRDL